MDYYVDNLTNDQLIQEACANEIRRLRKQVSDLRMENSRLMEILFVHGIDAASGEKQEEAGVVSHS